MSIFKKLDLFGTPFFFEMGTGNDKMKTSFGGILTLFVIAVSVIYFTYLNYMYIAGNIQPKISSQEKKITNNFNLPFQSDLIWFDIKNSISNENLMSTQKDLGQQLISYKAVLQQSDPQGKRMKDIVIPVNFCSSLTDSPLVEQTAQCLDLSGLQNELAQFQLFVAQGFDTRIFIELNIVCNGDPQTCISSQMFEDNVFGDDVSFIISVKEQQFNSEKNDLDTKIVDLTWDLDQTLLTTSYINLKISQTTIQSGFLLQKQKKYTHLSDAVNSDSYKTIGSVSTINQNTIARFFISLSQTQYIQQIQFSNYPEILAQFASIFNVLLLFGFIGTVIAKTDIYQFFIDFKLKQYYKLTALKILKGQQENFNQSISFSKESKQNTKRDVKLSKDQIVKTLKELDKKDLNSELTKKFKVSFFERAFRAFVGEEKGDYMKKKRSDKDIYEALFFQASQSQDVFELQAELMRIKKTLALILTPQQYAAIKCCGSCVSDQIPFLLQRNIKAEKSNQVSAEPDKSQLNELRDIGSQVIIEEVKQFTHIELIDKIDYDDQYFQKQLEGFLQESETGFSNYDESAKRMNKRLLDCLNQTYGSINI
ncbi:hypothetical protein ABPG74_018743 [Tetrahymena malaccensis]